ncbi:hypothetical protein ABBQ38_008687 [Trebouxia sp. C0009 RCD-2024]
MPSRWIFAGALLLTLSVFSADAQISAASTSDWTDFWGTVVNYKDGAAPSSNRRLHRHLLQSSATVVTASANATSTAAADWGNVMSTLLSGNWSKLEPAALQNFDWSQLGDFEMTTPLADLLQEISDKGIPTSVDEVKGDVDLILNSFCKPDTFTASEKMPASCSGPTVVLALEPHECLLDDATKTVTCKPAQLVLTKTPGSCAHKSESAVEFKGKECKVEKTIGFSKSTIQGGDNKITDLDLSKLTMFGDDSSSANSTATAGK